MVQNMLHMMYQLKWNVTIHLISYQIIFISFFNQTIIIFLEVQMCFLLLLFARQIFNMNEILTFNFFISDLHQNLKIRRYLLHPCQFLEIDHYRHYHQNSIEKRFLAQHQNIWKNKCTHTWEKFGRKKT